MKIDMTSLIVVVANVMICNCHPSNNVAGIDVTSTDIRPDNGILFVMNHKRQKNN